MASIGTYGTLWQQVAPSKTLLPTGAFSTITFSWFEQQGLLKVSERVGSFAGMDLEKNLCIVFVSEGHGVGVPKSSCDKEVVYSGHALTIKEDSETSVIFA